MQTPPSPSARPADAARHRQVHEAVHELLREHGVQISMDAVAARAGCSKQTLYARYGSKHNLMMQVLSEDERHATRLSGQPDAGNLRASLVGFARDHLAMLSEPGTIGTARLVTAQASQYPDEVRALYASLIAPMQERVAGWLQQAMRRGLLRHDDPQLAAELLLGMIVGLDFERQRFSVPHRDSDSRRRHWAEFAVDAFLRAFPSPRTGIPGTR